jgi:hypothetical protein
MITSTAPLTFGAEARAFALVLNEQAGYDAPEPD